MKIVYWLLLALCIPTLRANSDPLQVSVSLSETRIHINEEFIAKLSVKNISKNVFDIRVMTCSWDEHWKFSIPQVSYVGWACAKNFEVTIAMKPGETYDTNLKLVIPRPTKSPLSFQMGFTPIGSKTTFWSNILTVTIIPKAEQGAPANP